MRFDLATLVRRARKPRRKIIPLRPVAVPGTMASNLYAEAYRPMIAVWEGAIEAILAVYERSLAEMTTDSPADVSAQVSQAETAGNAVLVTLGVRLARWAQLAEAFHRRRWIGAVKAGAGADIETLLGPGDVRMSLEAAVAENVSLVKSVSDEARRRIEGALLRGLRERRTVREMAKEIREAVAMARRRALNIAADQTVKITASLNEERRRQAGISSWEWISSGKVHYRPEHKARNGLLYSDDPELVGEVEGGKRVRTPPEDRPGQLPYCGCTSRAVLVL